MRTRNAGRPRSRQRRAPVRHSWVLRPCLILLFIIVGIGGLTSPSHAQKQIEQDRPLLPETMTLSDVGALFEYLDRRIDIDVDDEEFEVIQPDSDYTYWIQVYDCDNRERCALVRFYAGFQTDGETGWNRINEWNADAFFGKAYIDEELDAVLEGSYVFTGGVSLEHFENWVRDWEDAMAEFVDVIDF